MPIESRDYSASWIWAMHHRYTSNCYVEFRKNLKINSEKMVRKIELCCHCFGDYRLYLGDRYIGRKGAPDNYTHPYYERFTLNDEVLHGLKNDICVYVVAHNDAVGTHNHPACGGGFWLNGTIEYSDGQCDYIQTDDTWQARIPGWWNQSARQMFWTTGFQEEVDLSLYEFLQKAETNCEDETDPVSKQGAIWEWANVVIPGSDSAFQLQESPVKKLCEERTDNAEIVDAGIVDTVGIPLQFISAASLMRNWKQISDFDASYPANLMQLELKNGRVAYRVFDFGTEVVGFPVFSFSSTGGGLLLIGYSECLDEHNRLDPARQGIEQIDTIRFGPGEHHWEMFNRRTCRYLQITIIGETQSISFSRVAMNRLYYPLENKGHFHCDNEELNRVYEISRNTLKLCMNGSFEDCPLRERAQYLGDVYVESLMAYYAFGEYAITKKALLQFAQEQRDNGWIPSIVPGSTDHNIVDYLPLYVSTAWNYYMHSGDEDTLRKIYSNLERLMDYLQSCENSAGFLEKKHGWWIFVDWAELGREGVVTALQCLYHRSLIDFARISDVFGKNTAAKQARCKAERLKQMINRVAYDLEIKAYVDCISPTPKKDFSIQTNCIAVLTGVAGEEERSGCRNYLQSGMGKPITTAYFKNYELQTLHDLGLHQKFWEGFGYWKKHSQRNTQTWWETFSEDMLNPPIVSLCHGWGAGPLNLLPQYVAGVKPLSPGFKDMQIEPDLFDLERMLSDIPTPYGNVRVEGIQMEDEKRITVSLPQGIKANILLPKSFSDCKVICEDRRLIKQKKNIEYTLDATDSCIEATFKCM